MDKEHWQSIYFKLDHDISFLQSVVQLSSRSHPNRSLCVQLLGRARLNRYLISKQWDDLERSIICFTEAICLPFPWSAPCLNIVHIFFFLAVAIYYRTEGGTRSQDVECCITYLRYLYKRWHEVPTDLPYSVTESLICALAVQVKSTLGDVDQTMDEMVDLCEELLRDNSEISTNSLVFPIGLFASIVESHFTGSLEERIAPDRVIGCLRKATMRLPDLYIVSIALATSLSVRFEITPSDDDCEEGMALLDKVLTFYDSGDRLNPYRRKSLGLAASFSQARFNASGKPEHLEQAIYHLQSVLDETTLEDLAGACDLLAKHLSFLQGLRSCHSSANWSVHDILHSNSESPDVPSFRELTTSLSELDHDKPIPVVTVLTHLGMLDNTFIKRLTNVAEIEDGIKYCQRLLFSYPRSELAFGARSALGNLFYRVFECTSNIEYLNKAISAARDRMNTAPALISRATALDGLISFLSTRLRLLHHGEDLNELIQLFITGANPEYAGIFHQVYVSCQWASTAHRFGHPSVSVAYEYAISSMQASLTFSPTIDTQHSRFIALNGSFKTLPLDYASYQIRTGRLKQAIETLERGRTLLWSEMRGLRTSMDQIALADSHLAENFTAVNRDLETLTLAFSSNNNVYGGNNGLEGMNPYGHLVVRQQRLLDDREKIISQIQALPSFGSFLKPPSFDILHSAACHGPVIFINHSRWRSDVLILRQGALPSLIPTSSDFYSRAKELQDQLLDARKKGLDSYEYEDALRSVLNDLFDLVGRPVIKRLNELNVPEQSRVWWCPTSVFCSFPLHAMGPIPSDVGPPRYFLDLYIPSYTPSLSALIESHKPGSQMLETSRPSMLLVLQPDASMVQAPEEMQVVQAVNPQVTTLIGDTATPTIVLDRLQDHRFAHIVCHGILKSGKPFDSSFKLYRDKSLSLLDIVRSRLPNAEFAFLAACHTAELTDKSPADEALHLAAAMQYCGFRSVVGTMWAMADTDGRDLAGNFYKSVFSGRIEGEQYYERTAEALRDAVTKLRRKRGVGMTLERWMNYVHYGA